MTDDMEGLVARLEFDATAWSGTGLPAEATALLEREAAAAIEALVAEVARLTAEGEAMRKALQLPLLFYSGKPWSEVEPEWKAITGTHEATTKIMCDHIRAALAARKQ